MLLRHSIILVYALLTFLGVHALGASEALSQVVLAAAASSGIQYAVRLADVLLAASLGLPSSCRLSSSPGEVLFWAMTFGWLNTLFAHAAPTFSLFLSFSVIFIMSRFTPLEDDYYV